MYWGLPGSGNMDDKICVGRSSLTRKPTTRGKYAVLMRLSFMRVACRDFLEGKRRQNTRIEYTYIQ